MGKYEGHQKIGDLTVSVHNEFATIGGKKDTIQNWLIWRLYRENNRVSLDKLDLVEEYLKFALKQLNKLSKREFLESQHKGELL